MSEPTSQSGKTTFENFGRKVDARVGNVGPRIEDEVKRVIAYLNDQVVPQARQNSSSALRAASEQLSRLADYLEKQQHPQTVEDAPRDSQSA